jgi:cellulose synthase/poly-beta-1,6-N-acetylglucosamine synthase-like glycosyltransferase
MTIGATVLALAITAGLIAYHGFNGLMIAVAWAELRRQRWMATRQLRKAVKELVALPAITVIVPAYNESVSIVRTVGSILRTVYPDLQVIVVSDGSTDQTLSVLTRAFALRPSNAKPLGSLATQNIRSVWVSSSDPRLLVVDKRNGGKADALNVGLNLADTPLVLATDADVLFDEHALFHLALPFVLHSDTVVTSGMIRLYNGCALGRDRVKRLHMPRTPLEACQVVEYLRAYGLGRLFFNRFGGHLIVSGAFGLFDRQLLLGVGGYQTHAIGEDMELVARLHRHCIEHERPYRIAYAAHAICYTEAPHALKEFGKQRTRWHHGLLTTLRIHRYMAFNRRYGPIGWVTMPYYFVELYAPALEALGWVMLPILWMAGALPLSTLGLFAAVSVLMTTSVSLAAILLDAIYCGSYRGVDRVKLVVSALIEPFWYRPCTVYFRLRAFYRYYRTIHLKTAWKSPTRAAQASR